MRRSVLSVSVFVCVTASIVSLLPIERHFSPELETYPYVSNDCENLHTAASDLKLFTAILSQSVSKALRNHDHFARHLLSVRSSHHSEPARDVDCTAAIPPSVGAIIGVADLLRVEDSGCLRVHTASSREAQTRDPAGANRTYCLDQFIRGEHFVTNLSEPTILDPNSLLNISQTDSRSRTVILSPVGLEQSPLSRSSTAAFVASSFGSIETHCYARAPRNLLSVAVDGITAALGSSEYSSLCRWRLRRSHSTLTVSSLPPGSHAMKPSDFLFDLHRPILQLPLRDELGEDLGFVLERQCPAAQDLSSTGHGAPLRTNLNAIVTAIAAVICMFVTAHYLLTRLSERAAIVAIKTFTSFATRALCTAPSTGLRSHTDPNQLGGSVSVERLQALAQQYKALHREWTSSFPRRSSFAKVVGWCLKNDGHECCAAVDSLSHTFADMLEQLHRSFEHAYEATHNKQVFIRYIFHELRVPFNSVVLAIHQLTALSDQVTKALPEAEELIEIMDDQSAVVCRILDDVLSLQKMEQGKFQLEATPFDLARMVVSALKGFRVALQDKAIGVSVRVQSLAALVSEHKIKYIEVANVASGASSSLLPPFQDQKRAFRASAPSPSRAERRLRPRSHSLSGIDNISTDRSLTDVLKSPLEGVSDSIGPSNGDRNRRDEWSMECPSKSGFDVIGDVFRLRQVLANFISNAVKFTPCGGRIEIQLSFELVPAEDCAILDPMPLSTHARVHFVPRRAVGTPQPGLAFVEDGPRDRVWVRARLSVRDNGVGVSPEDQKRLFEPYSQCSAGELQRGQGTGLGLSICKSLIKLHGGEIGCSSQANQGSEFFFTVPLPLSVQQAASPSPHPTAASTESLGSSASSEDPGSISPFQLRLGASDLRDSPFLSTAVAKLVLSRDPERRLTRALQLGGSTGPNKAVSNLGATSDVPKRMDPCPSSPEGNDRRWATVSGTLGVSVPGEQTLPEADGPTQPTAGPELCPPDTLPSGLVAPTPKRALLHIRDRTHECLPSSPSAGTRGRSQAEDEKAEPVKNVESTPLRLTRSIPRSSRSPPQLSKVAVSTQPTVDRELTVRSPRSAPAPADPPFASLALLRTADPIHSTSAGPGAGTITEAHPSSVRVLVVEDNAPSRRMLLMTLSRLGYQATGAENGEVAVNLLRTQAEGLTSSDAGPFDIVLMDNHMPKLSGEDACRRIRQMGMRLPIIGVTGNALEEDQRSFLGAGADHVMTKPVSMPQLKAAFRRFLPQFHELESPHAASAPALQVNQDSSQVQ